LRRKGENALTDRKHRKNKIRRIVFRTALTISVIAVITGSAFAAEGDQFKDFYIRNADILVTNNLFSTGLRSAGWGLVTGLVKVTDTV